MSNYVFVLDSDEKPLSPCHPARARELLTKKRAAIYRTYPFTIILKDKIVNDVPDPLRLKIDPGSKTTGLAILSGNRVIWTAELTNRGETIKSNLSKRAGRRRNRNNRKWYRKPKWPAHKKLNRKGEKYQPHEKINPRKKGWMAPSIRHRVEVTMTWVQRLCRFAPVRLLSCELVKFDMQKMTNPEISGVEYQQGEIQGYEVREYLLEKYNRTCVYCDVQNVPFQIDHVVPRAKNGSNRLSNLVIACQPCNQAKCDMDLDVFLKDQPERLAAIKKQIKAPLRDAAAVNITRKALIAELQSTAWPVETGSGAMTKFNRTRLGIEKSHWGDAACVGESTPDDLRIVTNRPLQIKSIGRGSRKMATRCTPVEKGAFPLSHKDRKRRYFGFQTGDIVNLNQPGGNHPGYYPLQRIITVRKRGTFDIRPASVGKKIGGSHKNFVLVQRADGYEYS